MLLTLCMIVRDEAGELAECLRSAQAAVDEIVIADTGSRDESRDIARSFGAQVVESPWQEDFALARNASLAEAHGRWVLVLDADERLEGDPLKLRRWLRRTNAIAAQVQIRNLIAGGREERHSAVRLFRRLPGVHYERRLHEQVVGSLLAVRPQGPIAVAPTVIAHHGYLPKMVDERGKRERNLRLALEEVAERPEDAFAAYALGVEQLSQGNFAAAAAELRRARGLTPGVEPWQSRLFKLEASALWQAGQESEALHLSLVALRHFPKFTDLQYLAGVLLARAGRPRDAERHLRQAIALGPAETPPYDGVDPRLGGAQAWRMLGTLLGELGRQAESRAALGEAMRLEPDDLGHVQALVEQHLAAGCDPGDLWRDPPPTALAVAAVLYRMRRWDDALAAFTAARQDHPSLPGHLHLLEALCHTRLRQAPQAWHQLRAALPLPPTARREALEQVAWALGLRTAEELPASGAAHDVVSAVAAFAQEFEEPDRAPDADPEGIGPLGTNPTRMAHGEEYA